MVLGYRAEGITVSALMAPASAIAKGDVVAFNANGQLVKAPANEKNPIGVAVESCTSAAGETPRVSFLKHGVAGVKASAAIRAGEAVKVGATAGEVAKLPDQAVNEAGVASYAIYRNEKLGVALQDIAAGAEGDIFVGA
jgi:predicted RecA/RadA family phage recombinase